MEPAPPIAASAEPTRPARSFVWFWLGGPIAALAAIAFAWVGLADEGADYDDYRTAGLLAPAACVLMAACLVTRWRFPSRSMVVACGITMLLTSRGYDIDRATVISMALLVAAGHRRTWRTMLVGAVGFGAVLFSSPAFAGLRFRRGARSRGR